MEENSFTFKCRRSRSCFCLDEKELSTSSNVQLRYMFMFL